jgi:hypothetical protein
MTSSARRTIMKRREFLAGAAAVLCTAPSNPHECRAKDQVDDLRTFATPLGIGRKMETIMNANSGEGFAASRGEHVRRTERIDAFVFETTTRPL